LLLVALLSFRALGDPTTAPEPGEPVPEPVATAEVAPKSAEVAVPISPREANGLLLGFAPFYKTKISGVDELNHGASTAWLIGLRLSESKTLMLRYQGGTVPLLKSSAGTTTTNASATLASIEFEYGVVLNDPFESFAGFQFFLPVNLRAYTNWASGNPNVYMNFGLGVGMGAGVRYYTKGPFLFDLTFLYHLGLSLGDMEWPGSNDKALNPAGGPVKGSATGAEIRLSATWLF